MTDDAHIPAGDVTIVDFHPEHTDRLVVVWRESFQDAVGVTDPHPLQEQRDYLLNQVVPHYTVRVVMDGGGVAGFIAANRESIAQLYLHARCQRRGIGGMLTDWAKGQSGGSLWLYTFARNTPAQAFYQKHGFRIVERGFEPEWGLEDLKYLWENNL